MDESVEEDWISLHVHAGAHPDAMDYFIATGIPGVLAGGELLRWFFVRMIDEEGFHLRLRLRPRPGERARFQRAALVACHRALDGVGALGASRYRPLVQSPGAFDPAWLERNPVAVREGAYEPELEKYGGEPGIPIAEELFHISSRIAVQVVRADLAGEFSRKTLAPGLMATTRDVFGFRNPATFWREYAMYWLGGDCAFARDMKDRFLAQAELLDRRSTAVIAPPSELPAPARALLEEWEDALRRAHRLYRRSRTFQEFPSPQIGFHFIHTMNNRLGLVPLEEAYLATLLELQCEPHTPLRSDLHTDLPSDLPSDRRMERATDLAADLHAGGEIRT